MLGVDHIQTRHKGAVSAETVRKSYKTLHVKYSPTKKKKQRVFTTGFQEGTYPNFEGSEQLY